MQQNLNVPLNQTTPIVCKNCAGEIFTEGLLMRKASRLLTGTSQDALVPIPIMYCIKCHTIAEETLPIQLKQMNEKPEPPSSQLIEEGKEPKSGGAKIIPFNS